MFLTIMRFFKMVCDKLHGIGGCGFIETTKLALSFMQIIVLKRSCYLVWLASELALNLVRFRRGR